MWRYKIKNKNNSNQYIKSLAGIIPILFISFGVFGQPIVKSTILTANESDQATRDNYHIDNIAWGFLPFGGLYNTTTMSSYHDEVKAIQAEGRTYHARIEFDAGWKNFIEYCNDQSITYEDHACLALDGTVYEYPWFEGRAYGGKKPYWMSSHSPAFKDFLKFQIDKQMEVPVEILMLDAQTSSALASFQWYYGDFSTHCVEAFRIYLAENYSTAELSNMGIDDITTFNYRTFLNDSGYTTKDSYTLSIPLVSAYRLFQNKSIAALTQEMSDYANSKSESEILVGVSSPVHDTFRATMGDEADFLQEELSQTHDFRNPILTYKIGEVLNKPIVLTAEPRDWKMALDGTFSDEKVKEWVAIAYANGANFIAPVRQWATGSFYYEPTTDITDIFTFISENKEMFDNYLPQQAKIAVIQSRKDAQTDASLTNYLVNDLVACNIHFDVIIAGDEYHTSPPDEDQINAYETIIMSKSGYNDYLSQDPEWKDLLSSFGENLILWSHGNTVDDLVAVKNNLSASISVFTDGSQIDSEISAFPRVSDSGKVIIHLINRDYSEALEAHVAKPAVSITLHGNLLDHPLSSFENAKFSQPGHAAQEITVSSTENGLILNGINNFRIWGIIELELALNIIEVTGVALDQSTLTLNGNSAQLTATVSPADAWNQSVIWASDDPTIVTVENGLVIPVSIGNTVIRATTEDGGFIATTVVTVDTNIPVSGISLPDDLTLELSSSEQLTATFSPEIVSNNEVIWASSDNSVASVTNGMVFGEAVGTADITATTVDGGFIASTQVNVKISATSIVLDQTNISISNHGTLQLTASINPSNATNKNLTWYLQDHSIASVENGLVTALMEGSTKIFVKTDDGGHIASANLTVTPFVLSIDEKESEISVILYPNPAKQHLTVSGLNRGEFHMVIYNLQGAKYMDQNIHIDNDYTIDLNAFKPGYYILNIVGDNSNYLSRFTKIK
ncbi:MAG: Ig-like domain-containing protein [Reichenbachiella sp.]